MDDDAAMADRELHKVEEEEAPRAAASGGGMTMTTPAASGVMAELATVNNRSHNDKRSRSTESPSQEEGITSPRVNKKQRIGLLHNVSQLNEALEELQEVHEQKQRRYMELFESYKRFKSLAAERKKHIKGLQLQAEALRTECKAHQKEISKLRKKLRAQQDGGVGPQ